ncbi:MAG: LysR family transcriptional regulator [Methylacidiphilales bacterium]|nr:LysR family transcriptional regulator [Candidatus Methylacidiphilales bacterium]
MQIESFKVFRDLVESRSFSKAASLNFITQSAVSQQIRVMEERFHVPLIERSNKRFGLTREGQVLYDASKQIVFQFDSLQHQILEMRNVVSGTIRLSTVYSIGLHEIPPYLKKFLVKFPNVNVHVEYRRSNQVYDEVIEGASDLGLVAYPVQKKTLKIEPFRRDRLVVITIPGHELAKEGEINVAVLKKEKFIGFEPDIPTRKAVDKIFREAGLEVNPVMEFDNIETVKRAVEIGAGVSIVPRATVEQEVGNGTLAAVEFKGHPYYRPLGIIYKSGRVLSPAMQRFLKLLKEPLDLAEVETNGKEAV